MQSANKRALIWTAGIAVLAAIVFFIGLEGTLRDWDESVYAQVARESLDRPDWYNLYWNSRPFIDKPPLMFWLTRLVYEAAGVGQWQARAVSATLGFLTVMTVFFFAWRFMSLYAGALAALVLMGTPHFVRIAKMGQLDVPVGFFIMLSIMTFYLGKKQPRWFLVSGVFTGLAILTKWSVGFLAPMIQVAMLLAPGYRQIVRSKYWWLSFLTMGAVCAPWVIQQYITYGDLFADHFLGSKIVESVHGEIAGHGGGFFYYISKMMRESRPWCFIFPIAFIYTCIRAVRRDELASLLVVWSTVIFLVFSLARTKLHWYIEPIYPPLALMTAMSIMHIMESKKLQIATLMVAVLIIPAHAAFSRHFIKLDFNENMQVLVESLQDDLVHYDRLFLFRSTSTPSLLFYTDTPVTLLHGDTDFYAVFDDTPRALVISETVNADIIREYVSGNDSLEITAVETVDPFTVFHIRKKGGKHLGSS